VTIKRFVRAWRLALTSFMDALARNDLPCGSPGLRCLVGHGNQPELTAPDRGRCRQQQSRVPHGTTRTPCSTTHPHSAQLTFTARS
jgi:hypothetical protein